VANAISERGGETTRLGSFEIVRRLARGGMAEIFLARTSGPSGFEKLVVLKKILPKYAGKPKFVQLFLDEARLAASLDHPHIAQVYDIGMSDGSYFFTMEYLHGQDMRAILHRTWRTGERFAIEHAVQVARHVASALHFAHDKQGPDGVSLGIVHRDVSPSNVIVTYDGATKLLDFGVAKTTARTVRTRTGALKGKISYMSPEQARGAPIDRRSDIYSLGIVLWEMITTQRLYRGENDLATLQLIITQPPKPPSSVRPDIPPELERIVLRALAQDPDERYATAEQLVTDLDELAREHKLKQTSNALAATVSQLFALELGAWRDARAAGVPLAEHLHDTGDMTTPVSESDFIELDVGLDDDDDDVDDLDDLEDGPEANHPVAAPPVEVAVEKSAGSRRYARPESQAARQRRATSQMRAPTHARGASQADVPAATPPIPPPPTTTLTVAAPIPSMHDEPTHAVDDGSGHPAGHPAGHRVGQAIAHVVAGDDELTLHAATVLEMGDTADDPLDPPDPPPDPTDRLEPRGPRKPPPPPPPPAPPLAMMTPPPAVEPIALPAAPGTQPAPYGPGPGPVSSPLFAAPPWHAGTPAPVSQPIPMVSDRIHRSWAIVDLPAFDPETFARQRRIVLRVTGGVIGFILLLAIIAGRC
jgi:serine/threonine protein kinase